MPIAPPSQIGLDVLRPPALPDIAAARAELARRPDASAAAFSVDGKGAEAPAEAAKPVTPETFRRFEAMVLQTFIQNMLPKDGAAVYGKGMAGEMWKSMLAEKVAGVVAERGGIGIADRMLGGRYAAETKPVAEAAAASQPKQAEAATNVPETGDQLRIAPAVIDNMQRSLSDLLTDAAASADEVQPING
jgi:Rod binding domain-containing protein